jgi:hypothetical protein
MRGRIVLSSVVCVMEIACQSTYPSSDAAANRLSPIVVWPYPTRSTYHWTTTGGTWDKESPCQLWIGTISLLDDQVVLQARWVTGLDATISSDWNLASPAPEFHVLPAENSRETWWSEDYDPDCRPRGGIGWYVYDGPGTSARDSVVIPAGVVTQAKRVAELRRELAKAERELTSDLKAVFAPAMSDGHGLEQAER